MAKQRVEINQKTVGGFDQLYPDTTLINNLTTAQAGKGALDASQGKAMADVINNINVQGDVEAVINSRVNSDLTKPLNDLITSGSGGKSIAMFTSNGTFTVPEGVTAIKITACGSGGDGSNGGDGRYWNSRYSGGGGGGGGGAGQSVRGAVFSVSPLSQIPIQVGSGNTVLSNLGLVLTKGVSGTVGNIYGIGGNGGSGYYTSRYGVSSAGGGGGSGGGGAGSGDHGSGGGSGGNVVSNYISYQPFNGGGTSNYGVGGVQHNPTAFGGGGHGGVEDGGGGGGGGSSIFGIGGSGGTGSNRELKLPATRGVDGEFGAGGGGGGGGYYPPFSDPPAIITGGGGAGGGGIVIIEW